MYAACKPYRVLLSSIAIALCPAASFAQPPGLPSKQIRIVVPNAAAGPNDLVARVIGPKLSETIGHPVVVENRPSPNGVIGSEYVARAVADGTVLAVGNSGTHAVNATLYRNPTYDPVKDFAAISEVIFGSLVLVAHPSVKANNVRELIAEAKRAPGKLNIAVAGATGEIAGNLIKMQGKIDLTNIPYKGGTPAVAAVMANESQLLLTLYSSLKGPIDSGKLKPIGVTGARHQSPPDLERQVARVRGVTRLPIAVGFGISTAPQVRAAARAADGVVVGSALVDALERGGPDAVGSLVRDLAAATRRNGA